MCRSRSLWESATGADQLALNRWVFRCPNCRAVLSTIPDSPVASPMNFRDPVATVKTPVTQNVRIESVERSQDEDFVGEEFPLAELQEWAREDQS